LLNINSNTAIDRNGSTFNDFSVGDGIHIELSSFRYHFGIRENTSISDNFENGIFMQVSADAIAFGGITGTYDNAAVKLLTGSSFQDGRRGTFN
jgi:hypothetical protein